MTACPAIAVIPIPGIPIVRPGDDLPQLIVSALAAASLTLEAKDVVAVCQKVVSKAEGSVVRLADVDPSPFAEGLARSSQKDPRLIEVILRQSTRIVRMDRGHLICETGPGWICANAGVDSSNTNSPEEVVLLPRDADVSAENIREALAHAFPVSLGVIVTDTFGRPWREGLVEVALGVSGIEPMLDFRGQRDLDGRELMHTTMAIADEIACAAGLVMLKNSGIAAAIVRGAPVTTAGSGGGRHFIRPPELDLFR